MMKKKKPYLTIYIIPDNMIRCNPAYLINIPLIINRFTNKNHLL